MVQSRHAMQLEILALRHQLRSTSTASSVRSSSPQIDSFGPGSHGFGQVGNRLLSSFSRAPSSPGKRNDSETTGDVSTRAASQGDPLSPKKFVSSSRICGDPARRGVHPALSGSCETWHPCRQINGQEVSTPTNEAALTDANHIRHQGTERHQPTLGISSSPDRLNRPF